MAVGQFEDFTVKLKSRSEEKASSVEDATSVLEFSPFHARPKCWKREQIWTIEKEEEEEDLSPFTNER